MASPNKSYTNELRDTERFIKFLAFKATQVIVQSRLGEKIQTMSNPSSLVADWFNLAIHDLPDVQCEAKKVLTAQMLTIGLNMCTEISLKTIEGDTLVLETWSLGMRDECDPTAYNYCIYGEMSLLLKSLIAATRVTPAYKLSCRQGPDSYVICYRIYMGEPQFYLLGEGYQHAKIGDVRTQIGTVMLNVMYRTKLTITPQKTGKDCPISSMMKSDYFKPDMSPKRLHSFPSPISSEPKNPAIRIADLKQQVSANTEKNEINHETTQNGVKENDSPNGLDGFVDLPDHKRIGAFAPSLKAFDSSQFLLPETSFLTVLKEDIQKSVLTMTASTTADTKTTNSGTDNQDESTTQKSEGSDESAGDDFVLVELKPPFADCEGNGGLGAFFRDFQLAPPLVSFSQPPTLEEQVNEIRNQLVALETSLPDLDTFVDSLCTNEINK